MSGHTSERVDPRHYAATIEDRLIYVAHEKSYHFASALVTGRRVLDLGCGVGYGARILGRSAAQVVGVDVSAEAIACARADHGAENVRFEVLPVDASRLPFDDCSFDVVTCFHVLEHVAGESVFVREIARVLAHGGFVVLSTPNARFRLLPFQNPWNRFHVREHTVESLRDLMQREFPEMRWFGVTLREPWLELERRRSIRYRVILWPITNRLVPSRARRSLLSLAAGLAGAARRISPHARSAEAVPTLDDVLIRPEGVTGCPALLVIAGARVPDPRLEV